MIVAALMAAFESVARETASTATPHAQRYDMALCDPCGGSWTRDCRCGWRCPPQDTELEADALCTAHLTEAVGEAA